MKAHGQVGSVQGTVLANKKPLKGATIFVERWNDSTHLRSALSNDDGLFVMTGLPVKDSLRILISFVGYESFGGILLLGEKRFAMAPVELVPKRLEMDTVVVKAQPFMMVKGDTIEFRTSAIKLPPNSVAADLVKRISGMELDRSGRITYNGRPVTKILVDGRVYFGEDGAIALANLPADMVDKVQLSGDSINQADRKESPNEKSLLNFKLKPGVKVIVKGIAAGGTDNRYDGSLFGSQIEDKVRISLTAGRNNINKTRYNGDNSLQVYTSGSGITKTTIGAVDFGGRWKSLGDINATYDLDLPTTYHETVKQKRQDVLPASTLITQALQASTNTSENHKLRYRFQPTSGKIIVSFSGSTNYTQINNLNVNQSSTSDGQGQSLNAMDASFRTTGHSFGTTLSMNGRRAFTRKGRVLGWNGAYGYNRRVGEDKNDAKMDFYRDGVIDSTSHLRQKIENDSRSHSASLGVNYGEPITDKFSLNLGQSFSFGWSYSDKKTWSVDSLWKRQFVDSLYSNFTESNSMNASSNVSIVYRNQNWNVSAGLALLHHKMLQKDRYRKKDVEQENTAPTVNLNATHDTRTSQWSLSSSAAYFIPSIEQLQPVQDATNPLQVIIGNPNLRPQVYYSNSVRWNNKRQQVNGSPGFIVSSVDGFLHVTRDQIATSVTYDSLGKQVTTYQNVNGIYHSGINSDLSWQKKWGKDYFRIGLNPRVNFNKNRTFLNEELYDISMLGVNAGISMNYNRGEMLYLSLSYTPYYQALQYEQNEVQNQAYTIHNVNLDTELYLFDRLKVKQAVSYMYNNSHSAGLKKSSTLWNATASLICLKSRKVEVLFAGFDLLKQFNNLSRTVHANYIEDTESNNLQQYFMVGVKYSFSRIL